MMSKGGYSESSAENNITPSGMDLSVKNTSNGTSVPGENGLSSSSDTNNMSTSPTEIGINIDSDGGIKTS